MSRSKPTKLRQLREAKGLTQQQLADAIGKPRTAVAAWDNGRKMTAENRTLVAKALGVTPAELGKVWDPEAPRPRRTSALDPAPKERQTEDLAIFEKGVDVPDSFPDAALFRKLQGLWVALEPEERLEVYSLATRFINPPAAPHVGKVRG